MEKTSKDSENKITLKDFIGWVVIILAALISTKFFDNFKDNELVKYFFVSLTISFFTTFVWIKIFINKKDNKLVNRIIREVETKKDLERQKEKTEESLERSKMFRSHAEKDKEKLEKGNKKLQNEKDQLRFVLSRCGVSEKEVGIDENISVFEWEEKPGIKEKIEEIAQKTYKEWLESERDVNSLSYQLENLENRCGISKDNQHVGDKRQKKWVIKYVEDYWNYIKADRNTGKIKGKTIEQFLGKYWRETIQSREGRKEIIEEKYRLKKLIDEFANS